MVCTVLVKCQEPSDGTRPADTAAAGVWWGSGAACGEARAGHHFTPDIVFTVLRWGVFRRWSGES